MSRRKSRRTRLAALFLPLLLVCRLARPESNVDLGALLERYKSDPSNALLCEQIGVVYAQANNASEAVRFFRRAVRLDPKRIPARKNLATVLWFAGNKEESEKIFLALETVIPMDPVPQLYLGLRAMEGKDVEQAARHFERAGALGVENPETLPVVIDAYISTSRLSAAQGVVQKGLQREPNSPQLWFDLGLISALQGDAQRGKGAFERASAAETHWSLPILGMGLIDLQTGHAETALEYFDKATKLAPDDYRGYYFSGISRKRSDRGDSKESVARQIKDLRRAVDLNPLESKVWIALGKAELAAGNAAEAEGCFRKATALDPRDPTAAYSLALLLRQAGKVEESKALMTFVRRSKQKVQSEEEEVAAMFQKVR